MAALMLAKKLLDKNRGGNPAPSPVAPTPSIDVSTSSKVPTREVSRRDTKKKAKKSTDTSSLLGGTSATMGGA